MKPKGSVKLQPNTRSGLDSSPCFTFFFFLLSTALAGMEGESQLTLAQENTTVSSNGPMSVGWGWEQQHLEQLWGAMVTDPSLSWIKLLVSSWGSSSGVSWDQLPMLSSLLALIERLSLFTTVATATAGLSLSLLGGEQIARWWKWPATYCAQCLLTSDFCCYFFSHCYAFVSFRIISIFEKSIKTIDAMEHNSIL